MRTATARAGLRFLAKFTRALRVTLPRRIHCGRYGRKGRTFLSDGRHQNSVHLCCSGQLRHQPSYAARQRGITGFSLDSCVSGERVLHIAPEAPLVRRLRPLAAAYVAADLFMAGCAAKLDLAALPEIPAGSQDLVIACEVLEHLEDDRKALREMFRVLAGGGAVILMILQKDGLTETWADPVARTPAQRETAYGLGNHHRIYGTDFAAVLQAEGFAVSVVDHRHFDATTVAKHVLYPTKLSPHPLATNHRRVYFGRKA